MKKLTDDLKRMLDGLACQDAGDYLSMDEKLRQIGRPGRVDAAETATTAVPHTPATPRRIAVVINRGSTQAAFDHALQACQRLGTHLDLLLSGPASRERVVQLEAAVQRAGVVFQSIYLSGPIARGVADYAGQHYSLLYIVAALDDPDLAEMIEETLPARRKYLPVPLVLVGNRPSQPLAVASAM
jgi:hypothetical protein